LHEKKSLKDARDNVMKLNLKLYIKSLWVSLLKSKGTPGKLTPKRVFILLVIFFLYPIWYFSIRLAYGLDQLFYPGYRNQHIEQPIFIVGNFRSGTTLLHRLMAKDPQFTAMKTWEIFVAPSIIQRKFIRWLLGINDLVGNPIRKLISRFENALKKYSYMHKTGLNEIEEDSHVFLHIWSTYDLFAFFPFPELVQDFIYYDEDIPDEQKEQEMTYYQEVLQRHIYANNGRRYISKSPQYSPKVKTLHKKFPDAKFINLVRSPLRVIPSSVSMFSNHWQTYGEPLGDYPKPAPEVMQEQAKHWYLYPHQYLKKLPPEQYFVLRYKDLTSDPKSAIETIYQRFGIELSPEYQQILTFESEKAKQYKSHHKYQMEDMGLDQRKIKKDFSKAIKEYKI
jgi:hypothetical protein